MFLTTHSGALNGLHSYIIICIHCNIHIYIQVLTFVRTRLMVSNQEVVAIHLSHNGLKFTHSLDEIRNAVDQLEWGKGTDSKDFLNPTKHSGTLINRKTSDRVRAANIFLNKLPKNLHDVLRRGKFVFTYFVYSISVTE